MGTINWIYVSTVILAFWSVRYITLAWRRRVEPNPVSWFVWGVVGVALFLTADASQAREVFLATIISAASPVAICLVVLIRETERVYNLTSREKLCLVLALVGYGLWFMLKDQPELAQWSLYWMIIVDLLAVWPTFEQMLKKPLSDKPLPWMTFGLGFFTAGFAITEHTLVNWTLPIYMLAGSWAVATPMIIERVKQKIPIRHWW